MLPESAHSPGQTQLDGGTYPSRGWSAVGEAAGKVVVLGSFGTVFFLDPETGDPIARLSTGTSLVAFPRVIAGRLVLAGSAGLQGVPMRRILGGVKPDDDWLTLQELRARSFLAQRRPADSLAIAEVVAREVKDSPAGWTLLAEAREALGRGSEVVAARVAAMAAAASQESPALRESHGLVWRLPTAPISAPPVVDGPYLLVGCRDGRLLTIDTRALRVVGVEQAPVDIAALSLDGTRVMRRGDDRRDVAVRSLELPAGDLHPRDPLLTSASRRGCRRRGITPCPVMGRRSSSAAAGRVAWVEAAFACLTTVWSSNDRPACQASSGGESPWSAPSRSDMARGAFTGSIGTSGRPSGSSTQVRANRAWPISWKATTLRYACSWAPLMRCGFNCGRGMGPNCSARSRSDRDRNLYREPYRLRHLGDGYLLSRRTCLVAQGGRRPGLAIQRVP